jgi:hypothetical protein
MVLTTYQRIKNISTILVDEAGSPVGYRAASRIPAPAG